MHHALRKGLYSPMDCGEYVEFDACRDPFKVWSGEFILIWSSSSFRVDPHWPVWQALWHHFELLARWVCATPRITEGTAWIAGRSQVLSCARPCGGRGSAAECSGTHLQSSSAHLTQRRTAPHQFHNQGERLVLRPNPMSIIWFHWLWILICFILLMFSLSSNSWATDTTTSTLTQGG